MNVTNSISGLGDWQTQHDDLEEALGRYEYHAAKATKFLLEAFAIDMTALDRQYPFLRKVHLPTRKPNADLNPGFSTFEGELLAQPVRPAPRREVIAADDSRRTPQEPVYVSPYPRAALDKAAGRSPAPKNAPQAWKESK